MFELLQKMYANDVELKIDKAPVTGSVMKFSMRSGHFCLVRYFNCDDYILAAAPYSMVVKALHIMLDEFLKAQGYRKDLVKRVLGEDDCPIRSEFKIGSGTATDV